MKHDLHLANDLVIRSLMAKLAKLEERIARLERKRSPRPVVVKAQRDRGEVDAEPFARMGKICAPIAKAYGVSLADIRGRGRDTCIQAARKVAVQSCVGAGLSTPVVGRFFDWRDHATILHLCGRREKR